MFKAGEYIHYSTAGLCRVEEITELNMTGADAGRLYYRLQPLNEHRGTIYTPVDNQKVAMRRVMSNSEAKKLIEEIPGIGMVQAGNEKEREQRYREALRSDDCTSWVSVIKTIYVRRRERINSGKKAAAKEERYLQDAVELLHQEIGQALGIPVESVEAYISEQIEG